jgi:hypothetical protein
MNESEALRFAANILRTLSGQDQQPGHLLYAARALDKYYEPDQEAGT